MVLSKIPCAWCGRDIELESSPKGGRPRKLHEECRKERNAWQLLEKCTEERLAAGLTMTAEQGKILRRDIIAMAWRMGGGRIG